MATLAGLAPAYSSAVEGRGTPGGLMLSIGTGAVAWSEQYIPSSLAALLVTIGPVWMVLLDWLWKGQKRPSRFVWVGLFLGLLGIVVLFDPATLLQAHPDHLVGALVVLMGTLAWSVGSVHGQGAHLPANPLMSTAIQMMMGGLFLVGIGLLLGESQQFNNSGHHAGIVLRDCL